MRPSERPERRGWLLWIWQHARSWAEARAAKVFEISQREWIDDRPSLQIEFDAAISLSHNQPHQIVRAADRYPAFGYEAQRSPGALGIKRGLGGRIKCER